jgi:hypothetical protein
MFLAISTGSCSEASPAAVASRESLGRSTKLGFKGVDAFVEIGEGLKESESPWSDVVLDEESMSGGVIDMMEARVRMFRQQGKVMRNDFSECLNTLL